MDNQQRNVLDDIAYSVGFLLGDGCLYADPFNGDYRIQWATMDVECLERIKAEMETDRPISPIPGKNASLLSIYCHEMWRAFVDMTGYKKLVPEYYFDSDKEVVLDVIAGMLDSDGSIKERKIQHDLKTGSKEYWNYALEFYNNEPGLIHGFTKLCKIAGIRTNNVRQYTTQSGKIGYSVSVVLRDFVKHGGYFHCKRKQARLDRFKERILKQPTHRSETKPGDALVA